MSSSYRCFMDFTVAWSFLHSHLPKVQHWKSNAFLEPRLGSTNRCLDPCVDAIACRTASSQSRAVDAFKNLQCETGLRIVDGSLMDDKPNRTGALFSFSFSLARPMMHRRYACHRPSRPDFRSRARCGPDGLGAGGTSLGPHPTRWCRGPSAAYLLYARGTR
jgi:hypothetical protein